MRSSQIINKPQPLEIYVDLTNNKTQWKRSICIVGFVAGTLALDRSFQSGQILYVVVGINMILKESLVLKKWQFVRIYKLLSTEKMNPHILRIYIDNLI